MVGDELANELGDAGLLEVSLGFKFEGELGIESDVDLDSGGHWVAPFDLDGTMSWMGMSRGLFRSSTYLGYTLRRDHFTQTLLWV